MLLTTHLMDEARMPSAGHLNEGVLVALDSPRRSRVVLVET